MKRLKKGLALLALTALAAVLISCATTKTEGKAEGTQSQAPAVEMEGDFIKEDFLLQVKTLAKEGNYGEALKLYSAIPKKAQVKYAQDYDLNLMKAKLLDVTADFKGADELCDRILEKKKNDEEVLKLKASIKRKLFMAGLQKALENGGEKEALVLYEDMPQELKDDFQLNLIKASLLTGEKLFKEAEAECDHLDSIEPGNVEVMEIRLAIAEQKGDERSRNSVLQKIVAKDPYNASANIQLGESAAIKKNYKQAKNYYLKALAKEPRNEDALFGYGQMDYYLENDEKAKQTFNKLLAINPQSHQAYSYLAKLAYANDEHKVAVDQMAKAMELNPDDYNYLLDYGMYLRSAGKFAEAEKAWTRAIEIDGSYFLPYAYRAGIYDEQDKFAEALADYKKVTELNPQYYFAYESIGILALHEKKWEEAGKAFFECRKHNQDNISYPLMVTYCYYMLGDKKQAKDYSNKILRKMGNVNSIEYKMLRAYHDEAGFQLLPQQIASLTSINQRGKMYFYIGLLYDMFGADESAKEMYSKVLNLNSPMFFEYRLAEWACAPEKK